MISQRISIVIPTLEEERHLPLLLQDIARQSLQPHEVIVVDGNSQDRTQEIARTLGATVLTPGKGVALQRSAGGNAATGDILVFLDADVRLAPNALERMCRAFEKRRYHVACPWFWPGNATWSVRAVFLLFTGVFWLTQRITPSGAGCCIVVRKAHFARVGGFSQRHTYDDIAFIRKAGRKGRYGILPVRVLVSDRRYRTEGTARVLLKYLALSPFFALGCFGLANMVRYRFAHYDNS